MLLGVRSSCGIADERMKGWTAYSNATHVELGPVARALHASRLLEECALVVRARLRTLLKCILKVSGSGQEKWGQAMPHYFGLMYCFT